MKKLVKSIALVFCIIALVFSVTGCSIFDFSKVTNGQSQTPTTPLGPTVQANAHFVEYNKIPEGDRQIFTLAEVAPTVSRSVVAISIDGGLGSGVIVDVNKLDAQGNILDTENEFYIFTCHHVIASGGEITVYVPDANYRNYTDSDYNTDFAFTGVIDNKIHTDKAVTLVGGDKDSDVAVLKLDITGSKVTKDQIVKAKTTANGYKLRYGEAVFAIGNPTGLLPMTLSHGIISYLNREVSFSDVGELSLMQLNLDIYHGSSGGALFNYYGELVGLTNAGSDKYVGINYAIPFEIESGVHAGKGFVNVAKSLIATSQSYNYGYVEGRWSLGITVLEQTNYNYSFLVVQSVATNSNAQRAGMLPNDVIKSLSWSDNGTSVTKEISSLSDFSSALSSIKKACKMGDSFNVVVFRQGQSYALTMELTQQYIFNDTGVYPVAP